jgi:hypothetical protein
LPQRSNICAIAAGELRTPTTARHAATFNSETAEADDRRPNHFDDLVTLICFLQAQIDALAKVIIIIKQL